MPADFRCPAYADGKCYAHAQGEHAHCPLFRCVACARQMPRCFGDGEECDECFVRAQTAVVDPRAYVS